MIREVVEFDEPVPDELADELAKRVHFVSEAIVGFSLIRSHAGISGIEVVAERNDLDISRKLRFLVANDVLPQRFTESKVLWESERRHSLHAGVFDELVQRGVVTVAGDGQVAVRQPLLGLINWLDRRIRQIATRNFGAVEYRYPTLVPMTAMARCGYVISFPQQLMFVARLHADLDSYTAFLCDDDIARGDFGGLLAYCADVEYCLPPTMCFHTYHQLRDTPLRSDSLVITSRGKSFRYESRYHRTLERLWDFTIREIVFLGSRDFVLDCRRRFLDASIALVEELGLTGYCETANDPFFLGESAQHAWSQRLLELKYELRLGVDQEEAVAVASFNFHERFFGDSFAIGHADGGAVHTACVGFGLERFAYAFLCHHGLEPHAWPNDMIADEGFDDAA
jgi:seryl-tRNA synthetase